MTDEATERDVLELLAGEPIGSPDLQNHPLGKTGNVRPEVKDAARRASKIWLPRGRLPARPPGECNVKGAQQIDLEDAVVAAGGERGGRRSR